MFKSVFEPVPRHFELPYIRALAAHYLGWKKNPKLYLKETAELLDRPEQTMSDVWQAAEDYYGAPLFETDGRGRTGRLTPLGQMVGALALHFAATDYLLRNASDVGDLGDFWANHFIDDIRRYGEAGLKIVSMIDGSGVDLPPYDEPDSDDDR